MGLDSNRKGIQLYEFVASLQFAPACSQQQFFPCTLHMMSGLQFQWNYLCWASWVQGQEGLCRAPEWNENKGKKERKKKKIAPSAPLQSHHHHPAALSPNKRGKGCLYRGRRQASSRHRKQAVVCLIGPGLGSPHRRAGRRRRDHASWGSESNLMNESDENRKKGK